MNLRVVNIGLSPNNTWKDTLVATGQILFPWNWLGWKKGSARTELENRFADFLGVGKSYAVGSGREGLYMILKSLGLNGGDEIILQGFTCMVVVNAIVWAGLKPVFVDMDDSYNLDPEKLKEKIGPKTRAVLIQHTFGIPAEIKEIIKTCRENNLTLIEDCAHAMGAEYQGKKVGTFGDLSFFSLGRSKVISCVSGGIVVVNNSKYREAFEREFNESSEMPAGKIFQYLYHPIVCSKAKLLYGIQLGKLTMLVAQKLRLINYEVTPSEKAGKLVKPFPTRLPNALAKVALVQFSLLEKFNARRVAISEKYLQTLANIEGLKLPPKKAGAIWLRFPIEVDNPAKLMAAAKKEGVILGDWYTAPVAPPDINHEKSFYQKGSCSRVEKVCRRIVNLPTHQSITDRDLEKIIKICSKLG